MPRDARVNVCAGWAPWWDATKDVLVEKTPDLALAALSAIFPARYEAAAIVVLRHPYFWHHKRHCPSHDAGCLLARVPRPRRLCVASTASTTQDAWIGAIKGALAPTMPLRLIVVRYEDLVLRTPEVSRALFTALNLPPTSRRRLALRGATTSSEHLWAFSAHAGGQPYAAAVHKCLADPRFTADVGRRLRGPLLAATGHDWRAIFAIAAAVELTGALIFIGGASAEDQRFDEPRQRRAGGVVRTADALPLPEEDARSARTAKLLSVDDAGLNVLRGSDDATLMEWNDAD